MQQELIDALLGGDVKLATSIVRHEPGLANFRFPTNGWTPLRVAAALGDREFTILLIGLGADVNSLDVNGRTPLHVAAEYGDEEAAVLLLDAGAREDIEAPHEGTAADTARNNGHLELGVFLRTVAKARREGFRLNPGRSWREVLEVAKSKNWSLPTGSDSKSETPQETFEADDHLSELRVYADRVEIDKWHGGKEIIFLNKIAAVSIRRSDGLLTLLYRRDIWITTDGGRAYQFVAGNQARAEQMVAAIRRHLV